MRGHVHCNIELRIYGRGGSYQGALLFGSRCASAVTMAGYAGSQGSILSEHFDLEPVSAAVLARRERARREEVGGLGRVRGMVVTTQPVQGVLVALRDAVRRQLEDRGVEGEEARGQVRRCLERVSVSRVFDLEGLWEVLEDLDTMAEDEPAGQGVAREETEQHRERSPAQSTPGVSPGQEGAEDVDGTGEASGRHEDAERLLSSRLQLPGLRPGRFEVADSDEDEALTSASSSPLSSPPASLTEDEGTQLADEATQPSQPNQSSPLPPAQPQQPPDEQDIPPPNTQPHQAQAEPPPPDPPPSPLPDIIVITHFSTILTTLFTRRENKSAHTSLQLLSSHMRHLSRTLPSHPLLLILNSTASSGADATGNPAQPPGAGAAAGPVPRRSEKPLDPTLRSVFNPPPLSLPGYRHGAASRRNKPSFGLVFAQLLDVHVLCTRVPRDADDADALYAPAPGAEGAAEVRYAWVIEVLLDETGVWGPGGGRRRSREQRWGVVDVQGGRVRDAFGPEPKKVYGDIRLAAGFGGPRV